MSTSKKNSNDRQQELAKIQSQINELRNEISAWEIKTKALIKEAIEILGELGYKMEMPF